VALPSKQGWVLALAIKGRLGTEKFQLLPEFGFTAGPLG